jgi:hypothetical protein
LSANQWYHVVVTYNGSLTQANRFVIYVDGVNVLDTSDFDSAGTLGNITNSATHRIGNNSCVSCSGEFADGAIDEVRYYDRVLNAQEIKRLYKMGYTN